MHFSSLKALVKCISLFLIAVSILSCQSKIETNEALLKSTKVFVSEDGGHIDEEYGSIEAFEKSYFKVEYLEDTIHAQAVHYVNACGDAIASFEFKNDTLILNTRETMEELCASADWYAFEYWIANPMNKKYVVLY